MRLGGGTLGYTLAAVPPCPVEVRPNVIDPKAEPGACRRSSRHVKRQMFIRRRTSTQSVADGSPNPRP
jgi:hypothetical protein